MSGFGNSTRELLGTIEGQNSSIRAVEQFWNGGGSASFLADFWTSMVTQGVPMARADEIHGELNRALGAVRDASYDLINGLAAMTQMVESAEEAVKKATGDREGMVIN